MYKLNKAQKDVLISMYALLAVGLMVLGGAGNAPIVALVGIIMAIPLIINTFLTLK